MLLKDEVAIQKSTIQRVINLNLKLQEDKNELEKRIYELENQMRESQEKKDHCQTSKYGWRALKKNIFGFKLKFIFVHFPPLFVYRINPTAVIIKTNFNIWTTNTTAAPF